MSAVRAPAVAGTFYPAQPAVLTQAVDELLAGASGPARVPKALVVPHAGYVYSGPIAATGYTCLSPARDTIRISRNLPASIRFSAPNTLKRGLTGGNV